MSLDTERIRKSTRRVAKFVKRNAKTPNADAVHKLRTGARHLDTTLTAMGLDSKRGVDSLLRDLKKIRKLAGRLRDMDVLTANALEIDLRGERDCVVRLLEALGAQRYESARKLRRAIERSRPALLRTLDRSLQRAERPRTVGDAGAAPDVAAEALKFSAALTHPGRLTKNNLHEYRLKVKELRDVLRFSEEAADSALVGKLDEVKDAIGDWHDWVELTDIAKDRLDHGNACALTKRLEKARDAKYKKALSLTHTLIDRHLRAKPPGGGTRPPAKAPIATPVLEAVAAVASEKGPAPA